jgi:hypothetical protein
MSVCCQINLNCDFCGEESSTEWTIGEARREARKDGWRRRKTEGKWLDICDACQDQQDNAECDDALSQAAQP